MPNEYIMDGNTRRQLTDEEQATLDASRAANAPALAKQQALAALRAPINYDGHDFAVGRADMAYYEIRKGHRDAIGAGFSCVILDVNGDGYKIASGAEFDAWYTALYTELMSRESSL